MADQSAFIRKVLIRVCLGGVVFFTSACASTTYINTSPQILPTCVSPSLNPYLSHPPPNQVTDIYTNYKNGSINYESARQDAFSQLGKNVAQWSSYEDIVLDDQRMVRISVTYLDPMLVQYILLNHALAPPNNLMDQNWFISQIQMAMDRLAKRNEIVFIVAITSPIYENALYVTMPIEDLKLVNASGVSIPRTHNDPILGKKINITQGPVYGYVGYPVSVSLQNNCTGVMDQWTTSLTLELESLILADNPFYALSWNIDYEPLVVLLENPRPVPTIDLAYDVTRFSKSNTPPTPNWTAVQMNDTDLKTYWEEMGRYIWNEVIMERNR